MQPTHKGKLMRFCRIHCKYRTWVELSLNELFTEEKEKIACDLNKKSLPPPDDILQHRETSQKQKMRGKMEAVLAVIC